MRAGERRLPVVISCEHGGNRVPRRWRHLFEGAEKLLASHRGWDPGTLSLARMLARRVGAPLVATTVTRLLVEPNRSLSHRRLFSELTRPLPPAERRLLIERYWRPHRERVEAEARDALARSGRVLHLGVHSFTPVLDGKVREVDVGVLYDPRRNGERTFSRAWIAALRQALPGLTVRANAPYRGIGDGLTTHLRRVLPAGYLGVELEVKHSLLVGGSTVRRRLGEAIAGSLAEVLGSAHRLPCGSEDLDAEGAGERVRRR